MLPRTAPPVLASRAAQVGRRDPLAGIGQKSHAKAPDVILLRGAVDLDREQVFMRVGEARENRFAGDALLVHESEIGVVREHENTARRVPPPASASKRWRPAPIRSACSPWDCSETSAGRFFSGPGEARPFSKESRSKREFLERVEEGKLAAIGQFEKQFVIFPVFVRQQNLIPGIHEEVTGHAQAVGQRMRDHRQAEIAVFSDGFLVRIISCHFFRSSGLP